MLSHKRFLYISAALFLAVVFMASFTVAPVPTSVRAAIAPSATPQPAALSINNAPLCTIPIPSYAVLGVVIVPTQVYYGPSTSQAISGLVIGGGKQLSKWYVIGQDATHQFWKIAIGCNFVWVPVGTLAPSPDAPNANAPLPTIVVS